MENLSGRIFLSELHGSTFFNTQKDGFYALQLFSDEVLRAAGMIGFEVEAKTNVVIIPVTGDLIYKDNLEGNSQEVNVGQVLMISCPASFNFTVTNPFDEYEVNFLLLRFSNNYLGTERSRVIFDFDLNSAPNRLINIIHPYATTLRAENESLFPFNLHIGQFSGRREANYPLHNSCIFCFVLSGAFEIQGRLLHAKDGLALWNTNEVEMEALSNNAVVLAIELPYI